VGSDLRIVNGLGQVPQRREYNEDWCWSSSGTRQATANLVKHKVSFEDAATVFGDPLGWIVADPRHSFHEERFVLSERALNGGPSTGLTSTRFFPRMISAGLRATSMPRATLLEAPWLCLKPM